MIIVIQFVRGKKLLKEKKVDEILIHIVKLKIEHGETANILIFTSLNRHFDK